MAGEGLASFDDFLFLDWDCWKWGKWSGEGEQTEDLEEGNEENLVVLSSLLVRRKREGTFTPCFEEMDLGEYMRLDTGQNG